MIRVLFVCLGNICRSPSAEGTFRKILQDESLEGHVEVDSAGLGHWHIGNPPDDRAQASARKRGIELGGLRARQVARGDFDAFDYVIAMDHANHSELRARSDAARHERIHLFMDFSDEYSLDEVPEPYYGGELGFERALDMIESASRGLLAEIRRRHSI